MGKSHLLALLVLILVAPSVPGDSTVVAMSFPVDTLLAPEGIQDQTHIKHLTAWCIEWLESYTCNW